MVSVVCVLSEKSLSIPSSQRHSSVCSCVSVISHIPSSCSLLELVVLPYACAVCIWLKGSPLQISATPVLLRSLYPAKSSQFSNFDIRSLFPEPQQDCCSLSGLLLCCSLKSLLQQKSRANMELTSCISSQRSKPCFVYCFQQVASCILCSLIVVYDGKISTVAIILPWSEQVFNFYVFILLKISWRMHVKALANHSDSFNVLASAMYFES